MRARIDAAQQRTGRAILLEVDGGVKVDNIAAIARAGADTFVAGSAIFGAPDYAATIARMRAELAGALRPAARPRAGVRRTRSFDVGAIAFDLDGTLLDTIHDLAAAVNALLAELGYPPLPKADDPRPRRQGHAEPRAPRARAARSACSPAAVDDDEVADGARRATRRTTRAARARDAALSRRASKGSTGWRAMGLPLAVVTNKATRFVRPHLDARRHRPATSACVVGGDDLPAKKPAPGPLLHVAARARRRARADC